MVCFWLQKPRRRRRRRNARGCIGSCRRKHNRSSYTVEAIIVSCCIGVSGDSIIISRSVCILIFLLFLICLCFSCAKCRREVFAVLDTGGGAEEDYSVGFVDNAG